jgi:multisubunit Na+/H+ antiporter MnhC subunit
MLFVITIENQITYVRSCQIFTSAIKLPLILVGAVSWTYIWFFLSIMLHCVGIYVTLYKDLCSA